MAKADDEQPQALVERSSYPPWLARTYAHIMERHSAQRLPHALLLSGPVDLGKNWLAEYMVQSLLCDSLQQKNEHTGKSLPIPCGQCSACAQLRAGSSIEFKRLQPAGKSGTIRIDQIRQLVDWLQLSAAADSYRIALIVGADTMNRAAANALLKTLEEPAVRSLCLLVADRAAQLPATIISRCQQLPLQVEDEAEALAWLAAELPQGSDAAAALEGASGAPLRALQQADAVWQSRR